MRESNSNSNSINWNRRNEKILDTIDVGHLRLYDVKMMTSKAFIKRLKGKLKKRQKDGWEVSNKSLHKKLIIYKHRKTHKKVIKILIKMTQFSYMRHYKFRKP